MVSVCMITYNHEAYISQAIAGVMAQKCTFAFELVIGVDACTDSTLQICEAMQSKHPDVIRVLPAEERLGMLGNLNRALLATRGKYIAFCEGDDYWTDPGKLQMQVDFMEAHPDYILTSTRFRWVDSNNDPMPKPKAHVRRDRDGYLEEIGFFDMIQDNYISTLTVCVVAEKMKRLIPNSPDYAFDYWYWLHLRCLGKIHRLNKETAMYRLHSQGVSHITNFFKRRWPLSKRDALLFYISKHPLREIDLGKRKILLNVILYLLANRNITLLEKKQLAKIFLLNAHRFAVPLLVMLPDLISRLFSRVWSRQPWCFANNTPTT